MQAQGPPTARGGTHQLVAVTIHHSERQAQHGHQGPKFSRATIGTALHSSRHALTGPMLDQITSNPLSEFLHRMDIQQHAVHLASPANTPIEPICPANLLAAPLAPALNWARSSR
eukprot:6485355-Amphidinium_carterae.1